MPFALVVPVTEHDVEESILFLQVSCDHRLSSLLHQIHLLLTWSVYVECDPRNTSSWKLLEKAGFRREAYFRQNVFFRRDENGEPVWKDTDMYAVLRDEGRNK